MTNKEKKEINKYFIDLQKQFEIALIENNNSNEEEYLEYFDDCFNNLDNETKVYQNKFSDPEDKRIVLDESSRVRHYLVESMEDIYNKNTDWKDFQSMLLYRLVD